jgi:dimethylaniline monooxygenase (N-oxide forming)
VKREDDHWSVRVLNVRTNEHFTKRYDVVMVCSGTYFKPFVPEVFRNCTFDGKIVHSKYYRRPENYADQTVLVIGGGPSGMDMSIEISQQAKKVYFAHRMKSALESLPAEIEQITEEVVEVSGKQIKFASGRCLADVDVVLLTTGYEYSFGFLDESCGLKVNEMPFTV